MWKLGLAGVFAAMAGLAAAQTTETVYSHKHWRVDVVAFEDGSFACMGQVANDDGSDSFSIWTMQDNTVRLQFYSTSWQFEDSTANLQVEIDRKSPWTLNDANLSQNSVLFDLPAGDAAVNFLVEVSQGTRLYLRNEQGADVMDYSLSGSSASIQALLECGDAIINGAGGSATKSKTKDANPFQ